MSFKAIAWALRQKLPCTQKMVLMMLADRHNSDTGQCNPSHDLLADDCGLTRRSVMDQIERLAEAGYIRVCHRFNGKLKLPNHYVLVMSFGVQEVVQEVHIEAQDVHYKGSEPRSRGSEPYSNGSEPRSHKPVIEPVKEPKEKNTGAVAQPDGIDPQVWSDFIQHRKDKKAKLTQTALAGIQAEAEKAGWTLEAALRECCSRGWIGFKADWVASQGEARRKPATEGRHAAAARAIYGTDNTDPGVIDV